MIDTSFTFPPIHHQHTLSDRDVTIIRDMANWYIARHLEPTTICRKCRANHPDVPWNDDSNKITFTTSADGRMSASCACSRWSNA
jgi:hypothetical protein